MGSLTFYPYNSPLSFFFYSMGGKKDLDVIVAHSRPFYTISDCKVSFNYPSRVPDVSVYEACLH